MTLEDLKNNGIIIQGFVNIKVFDDDGDEVENFKTEDYEYESYKIPYNMYCKYLVKYMYYAADMLQIELITE